MFDQISGQALTTAGGGIESWDYLATVGYDRRGASAKANGSSTRWLESDYAPNFAARPFSVFLRVNTITTIATADWIGTVAEKGANDPAVIFVHAGSDEQIFVRDTSGNNTGFQSVFAASEHVMGEPFNILLTRGLSGTVKVWVNGVRRYTSSAGLVSGNVDLSGYPFYVFARNNRGSAASNGAKGAISAIYIWDGMEATDALALLLERDPFGPFRPADEAGVVYPAGGGVTVTLAPASVVASAVALDVSIARLIQLVPASVVASAVVLDVSIARLIQLVPASVVAAAVALVVDIASVGDSWRERWARIAGFQRRYE